MSNLVQRIITGILFLGVMIGSIWYSAYSFVALMAVVAILCHWEYLKLVRHFSSPSGIASRIATVLLLAFFAGISLTNRLNGLDWALMVLPVFLIVVEVLRKSDSAFTNIGASLTGLLYVVLPFCWLIRLGYVMFDEVYDHRLILAFFMILWVNDTMAYVVGRLIGRHKLAPSISAGKTIEGTIGGILFAVGAAALTRNLFYPPMIRLGAVTTGETSFVPMPYWLGFAFITAVMGVISDLSESRLKRMAGVKDSSNLLPGHGGFLDRFDSVLLSAPVVFAYFLLIHYLPRL